MPHIIYNCHNRNCKRFTHPVGVRLETWSWGSLEKRLETWGDLRREASAKRRTDGQEPPIFKVLEEQLTLTIETLFRWNRVRFLLRTFRFLIKHQMTPFITAFNKLLILQGKPKSPNKPSNKWYDPVTSWFYLRTKLIPKIGVFWFIKNWLVSTEPKSSKGAINSIFQA